jgi:hypothetical protein
VPSEPSDCSRIRWLVGVHLVLAAAPLVGLLLQFSVYTLPILWALIALPLGGLLTLSVWLGFGRTRLVWRLAIGLAASFYLSVWPFIQQCAQMHDSAEMPIYKSATDYFMGYLEAVTPFGIILFLFGGTFMLMGLRFQLTRAEPDAKQLRNERLQFSMLQIMVVMSAVAIILSLLRATRRADVGESTWDWLMMNAFMFVIFFINTACAAFAALGIGKVKRNVGLVFAVSILLGVAVAIAMHNDMVSWWLFVGGMSLAIIPTMTVLASLLVVRTCGFRLVRRVRAAPAETG